MPNYTEYDHTQYGSGKIYPLQNPIKKGYGVPDPDINPARRSPNGRFVNQRNEKIDFWIEEIETGFGMSGTTAQSRTLRQFMPHSIVQPSIRVTGRAPNSFQYNRLASFVRASHWNALHTGLLAREGFVRHENINGKTVTVPTVRLIVRNGSSKGFPYNGRHVKGIHVPWALEGYIKSMKAGAKRFDQAPQFSFEFFIAESLTSQNLGIWRDTRVFGSQIRPWLSWIKKDGNYVTVNEKEASTADPRDKADNSNQGSSDLPTVDEVFPDNSFLP